MYTNHQEASARAIILKANALLSPSQADQLYQSKRSKSARNPKQSSQRHNSSKRQSKNPAKRRKSVQGGGTITTFKYKYKKPQSTETSRRDQDTSQHLQASLRVQSKQFEKARVVYSDRINRLQGEVERSCGKVKNLQKKLRQARISQQSFEDVRSLNSVLIIKLRRLQSRSEEADRLVKEFQRHLRGLLDLFEGLQETYRRRVQKLEKGYQEEVQVHKRLSEINLQEVWNKFYQVTKIVEENLKICLEDKISEFRLENEDFEDSRGSGGQSGIARGTLDPEETIKRPGFKFKVAKDSANAKLIEMLRDELELDCERRNTKVEYWRSRDDYLQLKAKMFEVGKQFFEKEKKLQSEVDRLKLELKSVRRGGNDSLSFAVKKDIQAEIRNQQKNSKLLKNKLFVNEATGEVSRPQIEISRPYGSPMKAAYGFKNLNFKKLGRSTSTGFGLFSSTRDKNSLGTAGGKGLRLTENSMSSLISPRFCNNIISGSLAETQQPSVSSMIGAGPGTFAGRRSSNLEGRGLDSSKKSDLYYKKGKKQKKQKSSRSRKKGPRSNTSSFKERVEADTIADFIFPS